MAHPDAAVRKASRAGFQNVVTAAREMGAPVVTLCTGSRDLHDMWKFHPENCSDEAWRDLCSDTSSHFEWLKRQASVLRSSQNPRT